MRKLLLGLLTIILFALAVYTSIYGVMMAGIQVNSIPAIKEENDKLDKKIKIASDLKNKEYPQNIALLEAAYKKLTTEKESYDQVLALGVDENGLPLSKIQEYEMEKIWVTVGNYATKEGIDLKIDITVNNAVTKTYNLNFTVTGGYIQITDFLYDIERDSSLVFKIENFKLVAGSKDDELVGTFTCKDIKLNISNADDIMSSTINGQQDGNSNTTTNGNTTTNNNTTTSSNTTNNNTTTSSNTTNTTNTTN